MPNGNYIESVEQRTKQYLPKILESIPKAISQSSLHYDEGVILRQGKVRDIYELPDINKIIFFISDRISGFDRYLGKVPYKGSVLNQVSAFWFNKTKHIMPNHLVSTPQANVTIAKKVTPIPIEFVVRNYLTGSTNTSVWTHYANGVRDYCGVKLPNGMKKNQKFVNPIITPTTKSDEHDELITPDEIIARGIMTLKEWEFCANKSIELFEFASNEAAKRGLILVDTKMEMGRTEDGEIILIDELFTPDSSRYWLLEGYDEAFLSGKSPKNIDKEFVREWVKTVCDPYSNTPIPEIPDDIIAELSRRYILLYEIITGQQFDLDMNLDQDISSLISTNNPIDIDTQNVNGQSNDTVKEHGHRRMSR